MAQCCVVAGRHWQGIFIMCVLGCIVFHVAAQEINITAAQLNGDDAHTRTVVKVKLTWAEAAQYCVDSKLGILFNGLGAYNNLDLRHHMYTMENKWPTGEDLWIGVIKSVNETTWYIPSCVAKTSRHLQNIAHPSTLCLVLNMTVDSTTFDPYMTGCEEEHFFVCTLEKGPSTTDMYTNMTLFDPGGLNILTNTKYNRTEKFCYELLKQSFPGIVAVYDQDIESCIVYRINPVFFRHHYQLLPVSSDNVVYVKTTGHDYAVADTLIKPVRPKIMTCVPSLSGVTQTSTTTEPVVTSTIAPIDTSTSQNTTMATCTCQPVAHAVTGGVDFASVIRSLKINKTALSSYKRKRMSVHDDRTSCKVMGYVAAIVIFGSCSYIIIMDIPIILRNVTNKRWMPCYNIPRHDQWKTSTLIAQCRSNTA